MTRWLPTAEVLRALGCSRDYLRAMMALSPDGIVRPWVARGTGTRVVYSWRSDLVDLWWQEVHAWQASRSAATAGASAGETSSARPTLVKPPPSAPRRSSSGKSKKRPRSADRGLLPTLSELLRSPTS